jgi:hypothetical protein
MARKGEEEPEIDGTVVLLTGEVVKNRETTRKAVETTDIGRMLSADGVVLRVDGEIRGCSSLTVPPSRIIAVDEQTVATASDAIVNPPRNTRKIVLVDWKRSEKLAADMVSKYRKRMRRPLHHLDDCNGSAYALQLSAYQYILEKYYGFRIVGRALADIHPACPFHSWTPYLHDEIEYIMVMRRERTRVRRELERAHPELRCAKSGRLLTDAVVDKEGRRYHRKAALFIDATVVDDDHVLPKDRNARRKLPLPHDTTCKACGHVWEKDSITVSQCETFRSQCKVHNRLCVTRLCS